MKKRFMFSMIAMAVCSVFFTACNGEKELPEPELIDAQLEPDDDDDDDTIPPPVNS